MLMVFFINSGTVDSLAIPRPRCETEHIVQDNHLTMVSWPSQGIVFGFVRTGYMFCVFSTFLYHLQYQ